MPAVVAEERARVLAVVRALKVVGVRVRNWKNFVHGERTPELSPVQDSERRFSFGRGLQLLPQHRVEEVDGPVPLFLVEACGFLSRHLCTEGLFRKTGSLGRIRTLRSDLERGERVFLPPRDALLQPCDVASVLKQFLRELPEPLIAPDLQGALCQAQSLGEGTRERATLLLTSLLTPARTRTLRYICRFLRDVALRCDQNRMEVRSLALVMVPNLLSCLPVHTERQLDQQAAAVSALILHAEHIGVVPPCVLETLGASESGETTPPAEGAAVSRRSRLGVYGHLSRQRRRSVGEIFVDAFSKLRPGRTPSGPPPPLQVSSAGQLICRSPAPQSPGTVKRKASEEPVPELDGSAKKRRSLHDLRVDAQSAGDQSADESSGDLSPAGVKGHEPLLAPPKRRTLKSSYRRSQQTPKQEERLHLKRRSLRFFSSGASPQALGVTPSEGPGQDRSFCGGILVEKKSLLHSDSDSSLKIPLILIEEPGRVVVGSEVDDDPDLLNCSFVENPDHAPTDHAPTDHAPTDHAPETLPDLQEPESQDDRWVLLEEGDLEVLEEYDEERPETPRQEAWTPEVAEEVQVGQEEPKRKRSESRRRPGPRRSMSMPEVALDARLEEAEGACPQEGVGEVWSTSVSLPQKKKQKEVRRRRCGTLHETKTPSCAPDPEGSLKKSGSRFSVVERFRSFSVLAAFLRTPTVRLRRQGARRRFSRSFSDEGVQQEQQAFLQLNDQLTDSEEPQVSRSPSQCSSGEPQVSRSPSQCSSGEPQVSRSPSQCSSGEPQVSRSPSQCSSGEPQVSRSPSQCSSGEPQVSHSPSQCSSGEPQVSRSPSQCSSGEPQVSRSPSQCSSGEPQVSHSPSQCSSGEPQVSRSPSQCSSGEPQVSRSPSWCSLVDLTPLGSARDQDEVRTLQREVAAPEPPSIGVFHLEEAFVHQCTLGRGVEQQGATFTPPVDVQFAVPTPPVQQRALYASPCSPSPRVCLAFDGVFSIGSVSLGLSPPTFHLGPPPASRRRSYRDSPRWPAHAARMSAWEPLPY